jgi:hypothetical protein
MNIISTLERDIARLEAYATYHERRAVHCRQEAALLKSQLRQEQSDTTPKLEELRELAQTILTLNGLTGAEIEAAENVFAVDCVLDSNARRLRCSRKSFDLPSVVLPVTVNSPEQKHASGLKQFSSTERNNPER